MVTTFYKIYFILVLAALALHCCVWAFSCGKQGLFVVVCGLPFAMAASVTEDRLQVRRLCRCGSRALERGFSSCGACTQLPCFLWNLPRSGIQPGSPALAGGFLSTGPPGKSGYDFVLSQESFACPQFTKVFSCDFLYKLYQFIFYIQVYFPSQISFGGLCDVS